jgi:hypothetical protein
MVNIAPTFKSMTEEQAAYEETGPANERGGGGSVQRTMRGKVGTV